MTTSSAINIIVENINCNKKNIKSKPIVLEVWQGNFNNRKSSLYNPTYFILIYLKFAYVLGISPFKVVTLNGIYEARKNRKTKIISSVICFLPLFVYFTALRTSINYLSRENPVTFFKLFRGSFSLIYKLSILNTLWRKEVEILKIVHYIESCPYLSKCRIPKIVAAKISAILSFYALFGVIYGIVGASTGSCFVQTFPGNKTESVLSLLPSVFHRHLRTLLFDSHYLFFQSFDCDRSLNNVTTINYLILFIGVISFCFRPILGLFADLLILSFVLTLYCLTISFTDTLQSPYDFENSNEIFNHYHYKTLRILSTKINSVVGLVFLTYIAETIFAYPINFHDLVWSPEIVQRVLLLLFYCTTISILIFSAESCRRMHSLRNWLLEREKISHLTTNEIVLMLNDLDQNSVGMSASGVFTLNYYFVGTVTSIVFTYFIIRLQWNEVKMGNIPDNSPISV